MKRSHPSPANGNILTEASLLTSPQVHQAMKLRNGFTKRRRLDPLEPGQSPTSGLFSFRNRRISKSTDLLEPPGRSGHRGTRRVSLLIPPEHESDGEDAKLSITAPGETSQQGISTNSRRNSSKLMLLASPFHTGSELRIPKPLRSTPRRRLSARLETSARRASAGRTSHSRSSFARASPKRRQSGSHALNQKKALDSSATFSTVLHDIGGTVTPDDYANPLLFSETRKPSIPAPLPKLLHQVSSSRLSETELHDRHFRDPIPITPSKERRAHPKPPLRTPSMSWEISPSDTLFQPVSRAPNSRRLPGSPSSVFGGLGQESEGCIEPELPHMFSAMCDIGSDNLLTDPSVASISYTAVSREDSALGQQNRDLANRKSG